MSESYTLRICPKAREEAIVRGGGYRFTVLTDSLIRMEYQAEGRFTDGATQTVVCRDFPVPEYRVMDQGGFTVLDDSNTALITDDQWIEQLAEASFDLYFFGYGHFSFSAELLEIAAELCRIGN